MNRHQLRKRLPDRGWLRLDKALEGLADELGVRLHYLVDPYRVLELPTGGRALIVLPRGEETVYIDVFEIDQELPYVADRKHPITLPPRATLQVERVQWKWEWLPALDQVRFYSRADSQDEWAETGTVPAVVVVAAAPHLRVS